MLQHGEAKGKAKIEPIQDDDLQFCWGRKGNVYYKSFTFDGTEYSLYDCVYVESGYTEPFIGKLVKIWETPNHEKNVETVWFFRPSEIAYWLRQQDVNPLEKEIFLACGQGEGVSNISPLETISGKCNIICSSIDKRNCKPTEEEMKIADFVFYRTFDVGKCMISDDFPSSVGGAEVDHFFNRGRHGKLCGVTEPQEISKARGRDIYPFPVLKKETLREALTDGQPGKEEKAFKEPTATRQMNSFLKDGPPTGNKLKYSKHFRSVNVCDDGPRKKIKSLHSLDEGPRNDAPPDTQDKVSRNEIVMSSKNSCREKNSLSTRMTLDEKTNKLAVKEAGNRHHASQKRSVFFEVSRRPDVDAGKWLKLQYWDEEGLREAHEKGTLVLLANLDVSFTSAEVEDIVWHAFRHKVQAKMIWCTSFCRPHSGRALAIFKTKEAADDVILQLKDRCLVLDSGRPIVGLRNFLNGFNLSRGFVGHLSVDRNKARRQRKEIRDAVSTSHFSQPNTIEYDFAMQWRTLQAKLEKWWTALYEMQVKELKSLSKQMKNHLPEKSYRTETLSRSNM